MNFMENYPDKDGVTWKWWQMESPLKEKRT
jgi:hypothetical protein